MNESEFKRWMKRMRLKVRGAAKVLDLSVRQIANYRSGESPVPRVVELSCKYLELKKEESK